MHAVDQLFSDCFAHLGQNAFYEAAGEEPFSVSVLIKQPDTLHNMGDGHFVGQMLHCEIQCIDVPLPQIGDRLLIGEKRYSIYQEPLKDPSQTVWLIQAVVE